MWKNKTHTHIYVINFFRTGMVFRVLNSVFYENLTIVMSRASGQLAEIEANPCIHTLMNVTQFKTKINK